MTHLMIDKDSLLPVHAYLDGELDTINALAVEERMSTDPALAAECERIDALQRLMHEHLPRERHRPACAGESRPRSARSFPARGSRTRSSPGVRSLPRLP
jgi:anti-sigma factor RsiW